jgi:hypothetical protein
LCTLRRADRAFGLARLDKPPVLRRVRIRVQRTGPYPEGSGSVRFTDRHFWSGQLFKERACPGRQRCARAAEICLKARYRTGIGLKTAANTGRERTCGNTRNTSTNSNRTRAHSAACSNCTAIAKGAAGRTHPLLRC